MCSGLGVATSERDHGTMGIMSLRGLIGMISRRPVGLAARTRFQWARTFMAFAAPPIKKAGPGHLKVLAKTAERLGRGGGDQVEVATVAAGCFWGVELAFQ